MKIRFLQSGGFVPTLRGCELDTANLPADEAAEFERLIVQSDVKALSGAPLRSGADLTQYHIVLETDEGTRDIQFDDSRLTEDLQALVKLLKKRSRPQRPA